MSGGASEWVSERNEIGKVNKTIKFINISSTYSKKIQPTKHFRNFKYIYTFSNRKLDMHKIQQYMDSTGC